MSDRKVPVVRFKGFSDDWEQRRVGDYYEFKNGLNKGKEFFGRGTPIVNFTDVFHNRGLSVQSLKGKVTLEPSEIKNYEVKKGDIFFTRTSETIEEIGYSSVMLEEPENTVFSGFVLRGRCVLNKDPLDDSFKKYVFFTDPFRNEMRKKSSMTTRALTSGTAIKEMNFLHPSNIDEQKKIGEYITNLDHLITLQQDQLDNYTKLKKALLQKLFPADGEKVPKVRFAEFQDDWESRKFSDFSSKVGKKNSKDLDYQAYSVSNKVGLISQAEQFDGSRLDNLEKTSYKIVEPLEFAYNPARINVGSIAFNNLGTTVIVSSLYVVFKLDNRLDNNFILQYIKSPTFNKEVSRNTEGSVRKYLFFENFINIKSPYSKDLAEQQKIGAFFQHLDHLITLQQNKLTELKNLKQSLLQKLFI